MSSAGSTKACKRACGWITVNAQLYWTRSRVFWARVCTRAIAVQHVFHGGAELGREMLNR